MSRRFEARDRMKYRTARVHLLFRLSGVLRIIGKLARFAKAAVTVSSLLSALRLRCEAALVIIALKRAEKFVAEVGGVAGRFGPY